VIAEYEVNYPEFQQRVINFSTMKRIHSKLVYLIFLNNAYSFLEDISEAGSPFVFTLYPGGGFQLNDTTSDKKLRTIFLSPYFKKVIVTQKVTYDYLVCNKFLTPDKIAFIYGGVVPVTKKSQKKRYRVEKKTFDICFVANKYMQQGIDKGYDTFIEVVKKMQNISDIRFHVVGSFSEIDIDAGELANQINFYGMKERSFFKSFYPYMDIILSPNIPFALAPGAFDGFPTGCCVEAALHGVAVFCTDIMGQNLVFSDRDDIVLITNNSEMIVQDVLYYYHNLAELYKIAMNGEKKFRQIFSFEYQMKPRIELLEQLLY
jgi:glycosyltransferase involved in cell wall biosynthesis